jgi:hypothetical protein
VGRRQKTVSSEYRKEHSRAYRVNTSHESLNDVYRVYDSYTPYYEQSTTIVEWNNIEHPVSVPGRMTTINALQMLIVIP